MPKEIIGKRVRVTIGGEPPKDDDTDKIIGSDTSLHIPEGDLGKYENIIGEKVEVTLGDNTNTDIKKKHEDLLIKLLLEIEKIDQNFNSSNFNIEGYTRNDIDRALELIFDEGLFKAKEAHSKDGKNWLNMKLTKAGINIVEEYRIQIQIEILQAAVKDDIGIAAIEETGRVVELQTISGYKRFIGRIYTEAFKNLVDMRLLENVAGQRYTITLEGKQFLKRNTPGGKMNNTELAELMLTKLYEISEASGSNYYNLNSIAEEFREEDDKKIRDMANLLKNQGLLRLLPIGPFLIDAEITAEGKVFVEAGGKTGIIEKYNKDPKSIIININKNTTIHGDVVQSNISSNSENVSQSIKLDSNIQDLLLKIEKMLKSDNSLSEENKTDLLFDLSTLKNQLQKNKKDNGAIRKILSDLGSIASIASLIMELSKIIF